MVRAKLLRPKRNIYEAFKFASKIPNAFQRSTRKDATNEEDQISIMQTIHRINP
jgi:hypothetical protein